MIRKRPHEASVEYEAREVAAVYDYLDSILVNGDGDRATFYVPDPRFAGSLQRQHADNRRAVAIEVQHPVTLRRTLGVR